MIYNIDNGAVFESTLNPETRRSGGMHYTSIENIHKVIDPLFLDDLKEELETIKTVQIERERNKQLKAYQNKLAALTFLDPAAGSGNFLTETYLSLRRLENDVLGMLYGNQIMLGDETYNPIKVSIGQFYGIEINDFAVVVAKTALWIAESQMLKETEKVIRMDLDFLPLKSYTNIVEGNALRIDWNDVVSASQLTYIMGNPPFVGYDMVTAQQKQELWELFEKKTTFLDYVGGWYIKAALYMRGTLIRCAFVSTNSITQGTQIGVLWPRLLEYVKIDFAYKTFVWDSEASNKAHVHCVIIGFSPYEMKTNKAIYSGTQKTVATTISPYLYEGEPIIVYQQPEPLCNVPKLILGNMPKDGGWLIVKEEDVSQLDNETKKWIREYIGATEFINNKKRYCLWLIDASPSDLNKSSFIMDRLSKVKEFRGCSKKKDTAKWADYPSRFVEIRQPKTNYLIIPRTSSENRRYIPIGYMTPDIIVSDACTILPNANMYTFGILTSNVHMAWMRTVCGRLKSDYRYSGNMVYNTFPWPNPTEEQKNNIINTAKTILEIRGKYQDSSLSQMYNELTMPPELRTAHQNNDRAVMAAYGFPIKNFTEADCVAELMKMYQKLTNKQED